MYPREIRELKGRSLVEDLKDYTVVDIETTGINENFCSILEISALKIRNQQIVDTSSELINPHEPIPFWIQNLTGITDAMVYHASELEEVLRKFKAFLQEDRIVGHNVNFDINFLYDNFIKVLYEPLSNDFVDTLRIARRLLPELSHHKLDNLIDYYHIQARDKHRALHDCVLTNQVYRKMCQMVYQRYGTWENFQQPKRVRK